MALSRQPAGVLYTIGHSNHTLDAFLGILKAHEMQALADVRSMPGSRKMPYFNAEALAVELPKAGVDYLPWKGLGGRRKALTESPNTGWRNDSFRGYADYMASADFKVALARLLEIALEKRTTVMCAEAVPWRCHRNLIADAAVLLYGWEVRHIMTEKRYDVHKPMAMARVEGDHLIYPADDLFSQDVAP